MLQELIVNNKFQKILELIANEREDIDYEKLMILVVDKLNGVTLKSHYLIAISVYLQIPIHYQIILAHLNTAVVKFQNIMISFLIVRLDHQLFRELYQEQFYLFLRQYPTDARLLLKYYENMNYFASKVLDLTVATDESLFLNVQKLTGNIFTSDNIQCWSVLGWMSLQIMFEDPQVKILNRPEFPLLPLIKFAFEILDQELGIFPFGDVSVVVFFYDEYFRLIMFKVRELFLRLGLRCFDLRVVKETIKQYLKIWLRNPQKIAKFKTEEINLVQTIKEGNVEIPPRSSSLPRQL